MTNTILFAAATVAPIFALIFVGVLLRRARIIGKEFITAGSKIVFNIALPAMVFTRMSKVKGIPDGLGGVVLIFVVVTVFIFFLLWFLARKLPTPVHGSFVQGAFRGNISIIGLAIIENSFSIETVQAALVVLMVIMPLYQLLAVIVLSRSSAGEGVNIYKHVFFNFIKNPLIWAIFIGLLFGLLGIQLPSVVDRTLGYLSQLTMPLALISIGGSLSLAGLMSRRFLWITASVFKLLVLPLGVWAGTRIFGISDTASAAAVITSACPAAVSGFAMAAAMGADSELAGEIVSATTLFSIFTLAFWIVLLVG